MEIDFTLSPYWSHFQLKLMHSLHAGLHCRAMQIGSVNFLFKTLCTSFWQSQWILIRPVSRFSLKVDVRWLFPIQLIYIVNEFPYANFDGITASSKFTWHFTQDWCQLMLPHCHFRCLYKKECEFSVVLDMMILDRSYKTQSHCFHLEKLNVQFTSQLLSK